MTTTADARSSAAQPVKPGQTPVGGNRKHRRDTSRLRLVGWAGQGDSEPSGERLSQTSGLQSPSDVPLLGQAMLLDVMGQAPVTFHRVYVDITGNVLTALWLSYAVQKLTQAEMAGQQPVDEHGEFVFSASEHEYEQETALTKAQQALARNALKRQGLLTDTRRSRQQVMVYRLNVAVLIDRLLASAQRTARALELQEQERQLHEVPSLQTLRHQAPTAAIRA